MDAGRAVVMSRGLQEELRQAWESYRVIMFAAPCGCGKTTVVQQMIAGYHPLLLAADDVPDGSPIIPEGHDLVFIDDFHLLQDAAYQQALCGLIRSRTDLHFIFAGRGPVPGWLMPFQLAGVMRVFGTADLMLDAQATRRLFSSRGITLSSEQQALIDRDMKGYPLALDIACHLLAKDPAYDERVLDEVKRQVFVYFDDAVYHRFTPVTRTLLISVAPFDSFDAEFAKMATGDATAPDRIDFLARDTSMLRFDGITTYSFWPIFRDFLLWEQQREMPWEQQREVFSRAALYYELHGDVEHALQCYAKAGENRRISEMLERNAQMHPGAGHFLEMEPYYLALPREEITRSPALMSGMSMLCAMRLDFDGSERWYDELSDYAHGLKMSDAEYREAYGRLSYLDIALPQRGSSDIITQVPDIVRLMMERRVTLPSFSVTSTLPSIMNGGKDFCEWSRRDELLYNTLAKPVQIMLGRDGVGLPACAICESKFEKGEDVLGRMLSVAASLGEIQTKGTPDIEFAAWGLMARVQVAQGKADTAREAIQNLRDKFAERGETRFLPNMDAMLCRIDLYLGDEAAVERWVTEKAPRIGTRLWVFWRYRYLTEAMALIARGDPAEALMMLALLLPYCERCGRVMDGITIHTLMAIAYWRRGEEDWRTEIGQALDACCRYGFIMPIASFGAAVKPLLDASDWDDDPAFLERLLAATRLQAVYYPQFLTTAPKLSEPLTAAELNVLKLICHNMSNKRIGETLGIKLPTAKTHTSHVFQKLGVRSRVEAREAAEYLGLV